MAGSEKFPPFDRFHPDLRYFAHPYISQHQTSPNSAVAPAPYPFIASFYPMVTGNEPLSLGYSNPAKSIPQSSPAAKLIALAATSCIGKDFSSSILQNFQQQSLKERITLKESFRRQKSDDPPPKKSRQQFDVESLSEKFPPTPAHIEEISQAQQSSSIDYGGLASISAWQQLLYKLRRQSHTSPDPTNDYTALLGQDTFPSSGKFGRGLSSGTFQFPSGSSCDPMLAPNDISGFSSKRMKTPSSISFQNSPRGNSSDDDASAAVKKENWPSAANCSTKSNLHQSSSDESLSSFLPSHARCSSTSSNQSQSNETRNRRRKHTSSLVDVCPVCGVTVRSCEVVAHIQVEIDKLDRIPSEIRKRNESQRRNSTEKCPVRFNSISSTTPTTPISKRSDFAVNSDRSNRLKIYQKVRSNRVDRLNTRVGQCLRAQRSMAAMDDNLASCSSNVTWPSASVWASQLNNFPSSCPVCCGRFTGSLSEMHEHLARCLRQKNMSRVLEDEDVEVDVESHDLTPDLNSNKRPFSPENVANNEKFGSEYEWCGQARVRATSLADRGTLATSSGFYVVKSPSPDPESDQYLNVDTDDTQSFGAAQYSDSDLNQFSREDSKSNFESPEKSQFPESPKLMGENDNVIAAFRLKIKQLDNERRSALCKICMETYKDAVISIQCWHVHCEQCWLRALTVKKLCPQCAAITPMDKLRRIYL